MTAPHLVDEQLSALLDEETAEPHLSSCASCSDRFDDLRAARRLLASVPPPLAPDVLDGFIARALETLDAGAGPRATPPVPTVDLRNRRSRLRPPPTWLISAAAAIAALAGVAGLLRATDGDGTHGTITALDAETSTEGGASAPAQDSVASGGPAPSAGDPELVSGDLGDQSDPAALAAILRGPTPGGAAGGGRALSTPSDALADEDSAGRTTNKAESEAGADAPVVAAPTAGAATAATPSTAAQDRARCRAEAERIGAGRLGALISTSSVRWKGEAAEVLVFLLTEPAGGVTRQALVLSRPACGLLADPRF